MRNAAGERVYIVGLDAWRAALMLGGIFLHASMGLPSLGLFVAIDIVSQTFRMGAFFGIAGVLAALVLTDRPPGIWLQRRLVQLGIPLTFGMLVIAPYIWVMTIKYGVPGRVPSLFNWYHLWFLVGLIIYSVVVYALIRTRLVLMIEARLLALIARGTLRPSTVLLATAATSAALFGVAPSVMASTLSQQDYSAFRTLQLVAGYLPVFLLGYAIGRIPEFGAVMLARSHVAVTVVVGVAVSYLIWFGVLAPRLDPASAAGGTAQIRFIAAAICPPAAFILIMRSALSIRSVPAIVKRISAASYTIYLLHLPIAFSINLALRPIMPNPYGSYVFAVVGSVLLSFYFHEHVVRPSGVLALLLNGKSPPRTAKVPSVT